jgi:hypothetical protein
MNSSKKAIELTAAKIRPLSAINAPHGGSQANLAAHSSFPGDLGPMIVVNPIFMHCVGHLMMGGGESCLYSGHANEQPAPLFD